MHHSSASSTSTTDLLTKPRNGLNPRGDCPTDILRLRTRYIITVIPVLNVNAGDDCIHAAAALIQSPPLAPAPAPVRPTPCPKERALFGANNKSQNGDAAHKGRCFSIPRIPINARVFPPPSPSRCAGTRALDSRHKRSTCPYLNSQWQSIISAESAADGRGRSRSLARRSYRSFFSRLFNAPFSQIEQRRRRRTDPRPRPRVGSAAA